MVEGGRAAQLADRGETVRQRFGRVVEELQLVGGPGDPALSAGPIVGHHHDQGVVELAGFLQEIEQPSDLMVGVRQETREHLPHQLAHPGGFPDGTARVELGRVRLDVQDRCPVDGIQALHRQL